MDIYYLLELGINGAMVGLMYSLVAIGIVLIYKSSSVPNLAQGALTMIGAYVVLAFADGLDAPMWLAIPLAIAGDVRPRACGIERVALRRLVGRPVVMILMLTLGLDIFLRGTTLAICGGTARPHEASASATTRCSSGRCCSTARTWSAAVVALVLFACFVLFFRTRRGIVLRAISDDYMASWSVGISVERGVALSWALASLIGHRRRRAVGLDPGRRPVAVAAAAEGRHGRGARRPGQPRRRDPRRHLPRRVREPSPPACSTRCSAAARAISSSRRS